MDTAKKIALLQRLIDKAQEITVRDSSDPTFRTWKNIVERTLISVFGQDSPEVNQFSALRFFYSPLIGYLGADYSKEHREFFDRDLSIILASIKNYIEELQEYGEVTEIMPITDGSPINNKVFISHSSQDISYVEELVEILEVIGLNQERIFCSSLAGYGIDHGDNFLDSIKDELNNDTLVLFVLSHNFYSSPICLCEMGAAWVLTKDHIPILIPPFDFQDVKGVFPLTQGFRINDPLQLNLFKERINALFNIENVLGYSAWERKRDRIIARIDEMITMALIIRDNL